MSGLIVVKTQLNISFLISEVSILKVLIMTQLGLSKLSSYLEYRKRIEKGV